MRAALSATEKVITRSRYARGRTACHGGPKTDQDRIFSLFFRAGNAVERFDGVGIGLFGAKKIVETHGGAILLNSEEGKGSTFTVRLPLRAA
jgi:signal transduction histidine kinase